MVVKKLKRVVRSNSGLGTNKFEIPKGAKITHFIVESIVALTANGQYITFALDNTKPSAIGEADAAGRIFFYREKATLSTNGMALSKSRYEFNLHDEIVTAKSGLFVAIDNNIGDYKFVCRLRYKV